MNLHDVLAELQTALGAAPRAFSILDWTDLRLVPHPTLVEERDHPVRRAYEDQDKLRTEGRVTWGFVARVTELGRADAVADVVAEPEAEKVDPKRLSDAAREIASWDRDLPKDPALRPLREELAKARHRHLQHRLPFDLVGPHPVFLGTIALPRRHLPRVFAADAPVPLFTLPARSPAWMLVPARFWPRDLRVLHERDALLAEHEP